MRYVLCASGEAGSPLGNRVLSSIMAVLLQVSHSRIGRGRQSIMPSDPVFVPAGSPAGRESHRWPGRRLGLMALWDSSYSQFLSGKPAAEQPFWSHNPNSPWGSLLMVFWVGRASARLPPWELGCWLQNGCSAAFSPLKNGSWLPAHSAIRSCLRSGRQGFKVFRR